MTGGTGRELARAAVWSSICIAIGLLNGSSSFAVDQLVVVQVEAVERRDGRGQLVLG